MRWHFAGSLNVQDIISMIDCEFRQVQNNWKCLWCGFTYRSNSPYPPRRNCPNPPNLAPIFADLETETLEQHLDPRLYGRAALQWDAAGRPTRTPDELAYIVDVVCPGCRHFSGGRCTCCGARGQRPEAKAVMATESCPAYRW